MGVHTSGAGLHTSAPGLAAFSTRARLLGHPKTKEASNRAHSGILAVLTSKSLLGHCMDLLLRTQGTDMPTLTNTSSTFCVNLCLPCCSCSLLSPWAAAPAERNDTRVQCDRSHRTCGTSCQREGSSLSCARSSRILDTRAGPDGFLGQPWALCSLYLLCLARPLLIAPTSIGVGCAWAVAIAREIATTSHLKSVPLLRSVNAHQQMRLQRTWFGTFRS